MPPLGEGTKCQGCVVPQPWHLPMLPFAPSPGQNPHILGSFSIQARCPVGVWGMCLWYRCLVLGFWFPGAHKQGV